MSAMISPEALNIIAYHGRPVLTTELLARLYGTDVDNIRHNYSRNPDRFESGKHLFKLEGDDLKAFRLCMTGSHAQISPKARSLILWTERGAARHAKMLDTNEAWDVFERLEDCYFQRKEVAQSSSASHPKKSPKVLPGCLTAEQQDAVRALIKSRIETISPQPLWSSTARRMWSAIEDRFGCPYKEVPTEHFEEVLALVARVPLEGELLPPTPPPPADLPREALAAIERRAHTLSLRQYDRIKEMLREAALKWGGDPLDVEALVKFIQHVDLPDSQWVIVHRNDLWRLTAPLAELSANAMAAIHSLEDRTGMSWYSK
jgi:hypothetical protein